MTGLSAMSSTTRLDRTYDPRTAYMCVRETQVRTGSKALGNLEKLPKRAGTGHKADGV